MQTDGRYIRFDWAIKRMLRDKANFDVLEGMISVFTGEQGVKIIELLESESNQETFDDKFNRVDIKAKNSRDEIIIVEVQLSREVHYIERMVYGVSKAITEQLKLGEPYYNIKKVYSINVVYFDLGKGSDYLYHGQVELRGVHTHDVLSVTNTEEQAMQLPAHGTARRMKPFTDIFPEYYLIRVNEFNTYAKTPIEEWMAYLKDGVIKEDTRTPGLAEAKEKLKYMMMSDADRHAYERHIDAIMIQNDVVDSAKEEAREEERIKTRVQVTTEMAKKMKADNMPIDIIVKYTGLTAEEIEKL